jgi:hypothetical protein
MSDEVTKAGKGQTTVCRVMAGGGLPKAGLLELCSRPLPDHVTQVTMH